MKKDTVFAQPKSRVKPFEFNREVAEVFDDMLNRSVPLYGESIMRQAQMASLFYQKDSRMYDLGCSHGNLGMAVVQAMQDTPFHMIGVDSSLPMIEKYQNRLINMDQLKAHGTTGNPVAKDCIRLVCSGMEDISIENASVVLMNLTLQFLLPAKRDIMIQKVYDGMLKGGAFILTEKVSHEMAQIETFYQTFYKTYKLENGYSELEISQKRDALEKVLIPDTLAIHKQRLAKAGFSVVDIFLKWFNFASILAVK